MLKTIREKGLEALWPAVIGAMLAIGITLPLLKALGMAGGTGMAIWTAVLIGLCCAITGLGGLFRLIGIVASAGMTLLLLLVSGTFAHIGSIATATVYFFQGNGEPLSAYGAELAMLIAGLLTLAGCSMARQSAGFYPALSLTMIALLIVWFSSERDNVRLFAPALIALCAMFARSGADETPISRTLTISAVVVVLALMISPLIQPRSQTLETFADRLRNYITDTLFFTEPRSVYSIEADGYKPQEIRLGGPVELEEKPVMTVETPRSILLRGVIYNDYTGLNWVDRLSSRRYLYSDVRNRAIRADALDETRPTGTARSGDLFKTYSFKVTMQSDSASTLFLPQRTETITAPIELVPYFNLAGEIFVTRNLAAGDTYSMTAPVINASDQRLAEALIQSTRIGGDGRDMSDYMKVPDAVSPEVFDMVAEVTRNVATPLDTAREIQSFLKRSFPYTLKPDMPPADQDFVSYFLLRGQEGYCTYFASAMAIMARIAGLPSRYVEGYIADPVGGIALVSSKHAHAWAEIYFEGFGWVAFDATPTESRGGPRRDEDPNEQEQEIDQSPEDAGEDENPNEPEPTPEPTPPPDGGGGQEENDDPQDGAPEEEPEDTPEDDGEAEDDPTPDDAKNKTKRLWWLCLLLVLALVGVGTWRAMATRPGAMAAKQTTAPAKLLTWYRALLGLLAAADMAARPFETPVAYAARVEKGVSQEAGFMAVAEAVERIGYARRKVGAEDIRAAERCYGMLLRELPLKAKVKWTARRMLKGIGSVKRVP